MKILIPKARQAMLHRNESTINVFKNLTILASSKRDNDTEWLYVEPAWQMPKCRASVIYAIF
jgi:hypothetical protein